jgi:hypothetical protein
MVSIGRDAGLHVQSTGVRAATMAKPKVQGPGNAFEVRVVSEDETLEGRISPTRVFSREELLP